MQTQSRAASGRQVELLERAYAYVLQHGLTSLSLRPLAQAIGSSPRVLLFLFGSKEGLVQALLARARTAELEFLNQTPPSGSVEDFASVVSGVWQWLVDKQHRRMLALWLETYAQSLVEPSGPCADFARKTVDDWLELLAARQPASLRRSRAGATERALALAVLRGALLDLLATGDEERTTAAVEAHLNRLPSR
ncbi:MAG TPA: TetR/AcrR family transcriptional regulator [Steroidobacteraceae bacterium]|jgi:AcrR family transcriptional regulator|nr:TetR/AcrR family transcriptional regulator [Steroidobacteraceae bacterium]